MTRTSTSRNGFSLMEIMVAVSIVGMIAAIASQQYYGSMRRAKIQTCDLKKADIEIQVHRFHRNAGRWPAPNLQDVGRMPQYFPNGLPVCPVDGEPYRLNTTTHQVQGHAH